MASGHSTQFTQQDVQELLDEVEAEVRRNARHSPEIPSASHWADAAQIALLSTATDDELSSPESATTCSRNGRDQNHCTNGTQGADPAANNARDAAPVTEDDASDLASDTPVFTQTNGIGLTPHTKRLRAEDLWVDYHDGNAVVRHRGRAASRTSLDISNVNEPAGRKRIKLESPPFRVKSRAYGRRKPKNHNNSPIHANVSTTVHAGNVPTSDRHSEDVHSTDSLRAIVRVSSGPSSAKTQAPCPPASLQQTPARGYGLDDGSIVKPQRATDEAAFKASKPKLTRFPRFNELPDQVKDNILSFLLENGAPIVFDTTRGISFISQIVRVPAPVETVTTQKADCSVPVPIGILQYELDHLSRVMSRVEPQQWRRFLDSKPSMPSSSYGPNMTPALFYLSKDTHARATRIFYSSNIFHFPHADSAWQHLEAFLATIKRRNSQHIRHLRLTPPKWHASKQNNAVAGALLDALSPATHLAVSKKPAEDRLFAAIDTCTRELAESKALESLRIDVSYPDNVLRFISRHPDAAYQLLPLSESEAQVRRRERGEQLLMQLSESMLRQGNKPLLVMWTDLRVDLRVAREFRQHLAAVIREAEKCGWAVDQILRELVFLQ